MQLRHISQYVIAMWDDWVSRMSGVFSLVFTVLAITLNLTNRSQAKYWAAAAVASYILASYWVWYKHRPDLKVELHGVSFDSGVVEGYDQLTQFITVQVYVVNTHSINNAIRRWQLVIENDQREWSGNPVPANLLTLQGRPNGLVDMDAFKDRVLQQGWPSPGWIRFRVQDATREDIAGKTFKLIVTDVYNATHEVKGRMPTRYTFDVVPIAHVAM